MSEMSTNLNRRTLLETSAALGAISLLPLSLNAAIAAVSSNAIRPFHVHFFPDSDLADLKTRVMATLLDNETVPDATQGVQIATMQKLAQFWYASLQSTDWRNKPIRSPDSTRCRTS